MVNWGVIKGLVIYDCGWDDEDWGDVCMVFLVEEIRIDNLLMIIREDWWDIKSMVSLSYLIFLVLDNFDIVILRWEKQMNCLFWGYLELE
jgi:hypothetical protein